MVKTDYGEKCSRGEEGRKVWKIYGHRSTGGAAKNGSRTPMVYQKSVTRMWSPDGRTVWGGGETGRRFFSPKEGKIENYRKC